MILALIDNSWFPGHIAKTLDFFKNNLNKIDIFLVVIDARAPITTLPTKIIKKIEEKNILFLASKADLTDLNLLNSFIKKSNYFKNKQIELLFHKTSDRKKIISAIKKIETKKKIKKIAIIGIPNVGKSTVINLIAKRKKQKTENKPGLTREINWFEAEENIWILDSPGILETKYDDKETLIKFSLLNIVPERLTNYKETYFYMFNNYLKFKEDYKFKSQEEIFKSIDDSNDKATSFYKKEIRNFQNLKYGKIFLEKK